MVGTIVGNIIGGWLTDKYGRYSVLWPICSFRDFGYRRRAGAERLGVDWRPFPDGHRRWHRPAGSDVLSGRVFPLCRQRQQSGSPRGVVPDVVRRLNRLLSHYLRPLFPAAAGHLDWLWRASLLFGAVPALLIIAVRSRFMNESPLWAANRGDLTSAVRILRDSGIHAHEVPAAKPAPAPKVSFRVLFEKPYRERTIVAGVMNICISFEYTAIAFFLPSILAQFLGAGVFETISASLGLNALFALPAGCSVCIWRGNILRVMWR